MTDQASPALWRFFQGNDLNAFTLIVDTPNGAHVRRIRPPLPLPTGVEHGPSAEAAAHTAATCGLSDFGFRPAYASKGSGRRGLGDRLLLVGGRGAVVQVKARTIQPKEADGEAAWIQKVAAKAVRQAKGTVRQLRMLPADVVNGRARTLSVDGNAYEWIAVFLLDHGHVPDGMICSMEAIGIPVIALTRRDWDYPFDSLHRHRHRHRPGPPLSCRRRTSDRPGGRTVAVLPVRRGRCRGTSWTPQPRRCRTRRYPFLDAAASADTGGVGPCFERLPGRSRRLEGGVALVDARLMDRRDLAGAFG
ncbi:hypothetical protein [Streptomyces griseorubiginosus]|uniref:hypothetical protein n=1 Tax=Streptomyces griseorubiginosus TaxID=67304 RepID=UPI003F53F964